MRLSLFVVRSQQIWSVFGVRTLATLQLQSHFLTTILLGFLYFTCKCLLTWRHFQKTQVFPISDMTSFRMENPKGICELEIQFSHIGRARKIFNMERFYIPTWESYFFFPKLPGQHVKQDPSYQSNGIQYKRLERFPYKSPFPY